MTLVTAGPAILTINPQVPAKSLEELLAFAKAKPDVLTYATSGRGAIGLLLMEQLKLKNGARLLPVAYKATGGELPDLIAGQISASFNFWSVLRPHVRSGKLRALAVADTRRLAAAPEIPTFAELGHSGRKCAIRSSTLASSLAATARTSLPRSCAPTGRGWAG